MVNSRRERERKKGGKIKRESTHLKNDSHDFLLFQKEMDGVVNEIGIS